MEDRILTAANSKEEKFLREKTKAFDFNAHSRKEISDLIGRMRRTMRVAHGIGLSANQIGLSCRVFVAEVPEKQGGNKFYAIFNPKLEKSGAGTVAFEEGCLSIPGTYGLVDREERVVLSGYDRNGKPLKIKAWGLLARVFQHEVDHLEGKLFIDRTKKIYTVPESDRLKRKREESSS
ncbi:peptide deformylase [Candidatus Parcubacteria bacterium]|nr:MAG: peptide deformylase [Candidatus Parcubacteria bacterium]